MILSIISDLMHLDPDLQFMSCKIQVSVEVLSRSSLMVHGHVKTILPNKRIMSNFTKLF